MTVYSQNLNKHRGDIKQVTISNFTDNIMFTFSTKIQKLNGTCESAYCRLVNFYTTVI